MKIIKNMRPVIRRERVFRLLGQKDKKVFGRLSKKIDRHIAGMEKIIMPRVLYTTRGIRKIEKGTLEFEGSIKLQSARLSKTLKKCNRITLFIATIGREVDNVIREQLSKKRLSDACICDAIGSEVIESTVEYFQDKMEARAKKDDRSTTLRFSPGYCDWKVQEQKKIFSVLENDLIDVDLKESCLMTPGKSVSGIFGIGDSRHIDKDEMNPCRLCGMHTCTVRRG